MPVIISPNLIKSSARIDPSGNIIDKRTKQILEANTPEYIPTPEEQSKVVEPTLNAPQAPIAKVNTLPSTLSIQEQIDQAKENLAKLEELKKLKIAEMKAELERLEA